MGEDRHLTRLGHIVACHLEEYRLPGEPRQFLPAAFLNALAPGSRVLDVGCGAGQTLRRLTSLGPSECVGLDSDLTALALGTRLADGGGRAVDFVRGSGESLPFRRNGFTHVICRVALTCLHQRRAQAEMVRVLRPGGWLYCHVEGPGFDLRRIIRPTGLRTCLSSLRAFLLGLATVSLGWQPAGGRLLTAGRRSFGTVRGLTKILRGLGGEVTHSEVTSRYLGLPCDVKLLAVKRRDETRPVRHT